MKYRYVPSALATPLGGLRALRWRNSIAFGLLMSIFSTHAAAILIVSQPWVKLSADRRSAEVYVILKSSDEAALIGASSFAAASVSIKTPASRPGSATEIALPANVEVQLTAQGQRIALVRLTKALKHGDRVPVTLNIRSADGKVQELLVNAEVRRHSAIEDELRAHKH